MMDRRKFVKVAAGAAAVAAAGSLGWYFMSPAPTSTPAEPVVVGELVDLTGFGAPWGWWDTRSVQNAVKKVNEAGGINGRPVKLVVEDTASSVDVGIRKFRKLALEDKCDFIMGSVHSGINVACNPIAKELKVLFFPYGMAARITATDGNRYVFRIGTHVGEQQTALAPYVADNVGKNWATVVADYAWGQDHRDWFAKGIKSRGGNWVGHVEVPLGTTDYVPYIAKIPQAIDGIFYIFWGTEALSFITQLSDFKPKFAITTVICGIEAIGTEENKQVLDGSWILEYVPRYLDQFDTPNIKRLRQELGVDDNGRLADDPKRVTDLSHLWMTHSLLYMIRDTILQAGWNSRSDHPKFITQLEQGVTFKESYEYPVGDIFMRPQDHQGFHQHHMSRVEDGKLRVKFHLPKEKVMYPVNVDYTKQPL